MSRRGVVLRSGLWGASSVGRRAARISDFLLAGTLCLAEFQAFTRARWQDFNSDEADICTGLASWEQQVIDRFIAPGTDVLVIGCGSGRDLLALAERRCRVTGVDPANVAIDRARRALDRRGHSAALIEGFFGDVNVPGCFDAVTFLCYSFIPESGRRIASLQKAAGLLRPGGHVLVGYEAGPRPRPVLVRLARVVGACCGSDWRLEPGDVVSTLGRTLKYQHNFQDREIEAEAASAGLVAVSHDLFPLGLNVLTLRRAA
jgi:SAM-dependent methyltransferase